MSSGFARGERSGGAFAALASARVYDGVQAALGAERARRALVRDYLALEGGERVLDVGCGTGALLSHLPDVSYFGVDASASYLAHARARFGSRARFLEGTAADAFHLAGGAFDRIVMTGLLHHLDDATALATLAAVAEALAPSGRLVTLDGAWTRRLAPVSTPLANLLLALDRGRHVRRAGRYGELAAAHFTDVDVTVRHDLLRVPYSHAIVVAKRPRSASSSSA